MNTKECELRRMSAQAKADAIWSAAKERRAQVTQTSEDKCIEILFQETHLLLKINENLNARLQKQEKMLTELAESVVQLANIVMERRSG